MLSIGVSVEKGLEKSDAAPAAKRGTYLMSRKTCDWHRLKSRVKEVLREDVPTWASLVSRPLELRFYAHQYARGRIGMRERRAFVFRDGAWFERHVGKATEAVIVDHVRDLDKRRDWWVDAYFGSDLFPGEVQGMKPDAFATILANSASIRRRIGRGKV